MHWLRGAAEQSLKGEHPMFKKSRTALFAIGLAALAGSLTAPATAAPGDICYFGECRSSAAPATPAPSAQPAQIRTVAQHGSWKAIAVGTGAMVVDEFDNGAKFAVLIYPDGKLGLMVSHPTWNLNRGQQIEMRVQIDGEAFRGTAVVNESGILEINSLNKSLLAALYRGRKGLVEAGGYRFEMTNLADAAAAIDSMIRYQRTASR
jgi:hypothetical protein